MPKPKKDPRKLFKCTRKVIADQEYLCIRMKNLRPIDVRELRNEINLLTKDFFVQEEPEQPEPEEEKRQVRFEKSSR